MIANRTDVDQAMDRKERSHNANTTIQQNDDQELRTFAASEVGVTLRVSDAALKEIDRLQLENFRAAKESYKIFWR